MKQNAKIREEIKRSGVPQWMIAAKLCIAESTFIRWLRFPLTEEREQKIISAINALVKESLV